MKKLACCLALLASTATAAEIAPAAASLHPNLAGQVSRPIRYRPDGPDFVIHNGAEFFNRSLYGGHSAFRVDGGDNPEFMLYLPGRGGNLRLALRWPGGARWLHEAASIDTRYRPGELLYELRDPAWGATAVLRLDVLAYARTEGLILRAEGKGLPPGAELLWSYGGVNGERGRRDGDISTERVPIAQYFQFRPEFAARNQFTISGEGFTLSSPAATIAGVVPAGTALHVAEGGAWNDLAAMLSPDASSATPVMVARTPLINAQPLLISLQRIGAAQAADLDVYAAVTTQPAPAPSGKSGALDPAYARAQLPRLFDETRQHFAALRDRVRIETPDPYLNAAAGALNVATDALWDDSAQSIMHGAIAWRTRLLGWRGPYALDALGWHERARLNAEGWTRGQNTSAIPPALPSADTASKLARNEAGLHSNGDMSHSHYDMNTVFMDALLRHILWTGDLEYTRAVWPVIERHLAWQQRLFRREFGPDKLPLYEAYASIWASDDIYYNGGGVSYASAYNVYANRGAARLARLLGKDPSPYEREAALVAQAMRSLLWMPEQGAFAEYRDVLGLQQLHPSYGLWTFYHTIDSEVPTAAEAHQMAAALLRDFQAIPVAGEGVPADAAYHMLATTNWMPYSWSANNVVMGENLHTALALWQADQPEEAYMLAKSALLASMYMGISPGNVGTMNYLDVYRRESQRDFADGAGVLSRALVEGLFGIHPDALAGTLSVHPGLPASWTHARITHPDLALSFSRSGATDRWALQDVAPRFRSLRLQLPSTSRAPASVTVNGQAMSWHTAADMTVIETPLNHGRAEVDITWRAATLPTRAAATMAASSEHISSPAIDWTTPRNGARYDSISLAAYFNDRITEIFKPGKYQSPRSPYVSLSLPAQGAGAWAGHLDTLPEIDDTGLRSAARAGGGNIVMPNGVPFATPSQSGTPNIVFTSQWNNYPREAQIPLAGTAKRAWLLMAGSTNFMQSRLDNGEVIVRYTDGTSTRLALHNPDNWWPIEQDYLIDDYQFRRPGPIPPRVDLKTGKVRLQTSGGAVAGGAATAQCIPLESARTLRSLTLRTLSNDVVIGLMSVTLER
ncbi:DUF4450 domain-containing protein [Pseudoduganella sp. RAF19]|uniref:DUF4450 domain-containing protein n=2 Tax=unclassified Pseudoduganella TaxID=2637179 RepID=UPI003F95F4B5